MSPRISRSWFSGAVFGAAIATPHSQDREMVSRRGAQPVPAPPERRRWSIQSRPRSAGWDWIDQRLCVPGGLHAEGHLLLLSQGRKQQKVTSCADLETGTHRTQTLACPLEFCAPKPEWTGRRCGGERVDEQLRPQTSRSRSRAGRRAGADAGAEAEPSAGPEPKPKRAPGRSPQRRSAARPLSEPDQARHVGVRLVGVIVVDAVGVDVRRADQSTKSVDAPTPHGRGGAGGARCSAASTATRSTAARRRPRPARGCRDHGRPGQRCGGRAREGRRLSGYPRMVFWV